MSARVTIAALAVSLVAAGAATSGPSAPAGHGTYTDVRVDGSSATIVVPVTVITSLFEEDGPPDPVATDFVRAGFAAAAAYWDEAFAKLGGCIELRLELDVEFASAEAYRDSGGPESRHLINPSAHWRSGELADGRGLPTVTYPGLPPETPGTDDLTYPFDMQTEAYFPEWLFEDRWALAHELGHLLGLGDDYHEGEPVEGREGTLMAGLAGGADYVDRAIVDDILKLIREAGYRLPECWDGDWEGSTALPGCSPADVPLHGTISFTVDADGAVSGRNAVAHETFTCGPQSQPNARFGGDFTGRRTEAGFELDVFAGTGYPPLELLRTGDEAAGEYEVGPQRGRITVRCAGCG